MKMLELVGLVFGIWALVLTGCGDLTDGQSVQEFPEAEEPGVEVSYASAVDTKITSSPPAPSNSPNATFKFKCNKPSCSFKCRLDGNPWTACKSPKTYTGLSNGAHTFQVKAKDNATGKWDTSSVFYNWTIFLANSVSAGGSHTCAPLSSGGVKCWGWNFYGQHGNGLTVNSNIPMDVAGLSSYAVSVSGGRGHTCAVFASGGVKCWGDNYYGQLGNGNNNDSYFPVDVSGLSSGVSAVSAGGNHTCALLTSGGVRCWGYNAHGQLGNGTNTNSNVPVNVSGLSSGVSEVSAGNYHSCAVLSSGAVKCWGRNYYGQLGNGDNTNSNVPVTAIGSGASTVSAGWGHTCAVLSSGGVKCWGDNDHGQLGDGNTADSNVPVDVSGLTSGVNMVSAGNGHTCAILSSGGVKCWGRNTNGQLGTGNNKYSNIPVAVYNLSSVVSVSTGDYHTCAYLISGEIKCWGDNDSGQLGNKTFNDSNVPVRVFGF